MEWVEAGGKEGVVTGGGSRVGRVGAETQGASRHDGAVIQGGCALGHGSRVTTPPLRGPGLQACAPSLGPRATGARATL
ncbi:hypothetical protein MA03_07915 [Infirmifilum uzonense]|uniref:Uncharacterized protein n=1 Tax=Infirmifilum uzonense TaxID=1550241 RepID=A0A0F7FHT1_9CREN|nr:hypothetical protein MA03_05015 [Infirmifilum uzonense]AKG39173.1 hypothetical protein MA03_07915 [Infirmifilum uzonense]